MSDPVIEEIKRFKDQLDELLNKKYTDPAIILGINNVIQSKFENWIILDIKEYYESIEVYGSNNNNQIEFNTIKFFDTLWSNFHYPIIKFFQYNHAQIFNRVLEKYNNNNILTLKPVEIRKLNDFFIKFIKAIHTFYFNLLKFFATHYKNPLIPNQLLHHFEFSKSITSEHEPEPAISCDNSNLQANLLYLIHKCLLCLGDISRHRSFIEISFVLPNLLVKQFHKFRSTVNEKKIQLMKPYYNTALTFYKFCILILPALNEPYNHIAMIHNLIDDKIGACYWFLRSHFTRIVSYKLGIANLNNLLKKNWFKTQLVEILIKSNINDFNNKPLNTKNYQLNIILVILINFFYMPNHYRYNNSKKIVKNLKYDKIEFIFLNLNFNTDNFIKLLDTPGNDPEIELNFYVKQLVLLISFGKLIALNTNNFKPFEDFLVKYLESFFLNVISLPTEVLNPNNSGSSEILKNILVFMRILLNYFKEEKISLKVQKFSLISLLVSTLNKFLNSLDNLSENQAGENQSGETNEDVSISQESKYIELIDDLNSSNSRPIRNYYFKEDVIFKDFQIIKYQFKDFKDDHLFQTNDINLLNNDFRSLTFNKFPSFLDNRIFLNLQDRYDENMVKTEILKYENFLRMKATLMLAKKLLSNKVKFDNKFVIAESFKTEVERFKSRKSKPRRERKRKAKGKSLDRKREPERTANSATSHDTNKIEPVIQATNGDKGKNEHEDGGRLENYNGKENRGKYEEYDDGDGDDDDDDNYDYYEDDEEDGDEEDVDDDDSDSSIDEIESFIRNHTNQLQSQMEVNTEPVQSITQSTSSNIWNKNVGTLLNNSQLSQPQVDSHSQTYGSSEVNPNGLPVHQVSASTAFSTSSQPVNGNNTSVNSNGGNQVLPSTPAQSAQHQHQHQHQQPVPSQAPTVPIGGQQPIPPFQQPFAPQGPVQVPQTPIFPGMLPPSGGSPNLHPSMQMNPYQFQAGNTPYSNYQSPVPTQGYYNPYNFGQNPPPLGQSTQSTNSQLTASANPSQNPSSQQPLQSQFPQFPYPHQPPQHYPHQQAYGQYMRTPAPGSYDPLTQLTSQPYINSLQNNQSYSQQS